MGCEVGSDTDPVLERDVGGEAEKSGRCLIRSAGGAYVESGPSSTVALIDEIVRLGLCLLE